MYFTLVQSFPQHNVLFIYYGSHFFLVKNIKGVLYINVKIYYGTHTYVFQKPTVTTL